MKSLYARLISKDNLVMFSLNQWWETCCSLQFYCDSQLELLLPKGKS